MSKRIDRTWLVYASLENDEHTRCVDFFRRPDMTYGFEEFRRDPEDEGRWTPIAYYSCIPCSSNEAAASLARATISWLSDPALGDLAVG